MLVPIICRTFVPVKVMWLLVLLAVVCCLTTSAKDGVRRVAPFGKILLYSNENILVGDVNGDDRVDMVDVTLTIRHLTVATSDDFPEQAADVNMDGFLTAADVPLIVNIILKGGCPDSHHPHSVDLGLPSGTKWACCNVGAKSPPAAGRYYSWGQRYENNPYLYNWDMYPYGDYYDDEDYSELDYLGSDIAATIYDAALYSWGAPWRMPSLEQCRELIEYTTSVWIEFDGVHGRLFTGRNGCTIFLPAVGDHWYYKHMFNGTDGLYWSSTLVDEYPCAAYFLSFTSRRVCDDYYFRYAGMPVRPVCNE